MLQGILIFQYTNVGSRSEGYFPYLYLGYGNMVKVAYVKDAPFTNAILREYDGKPMAFEGHFNDNNTFIAKSFTELNSVELEKPEPLPFSDGADILELADEVAPASMAGTDELSSDDAAPSESDPS